MMVIPTLAIAQPNRTAIAENIKTQIEYKTESTYPTTPFPVGNAQPKPEPIKIAYSAPVMPTDPKMFIYLHESGNVPERYNSSGCLGLGQACPASKLLAVCPVETDYACQDQWFTDYMTHRYGTWENAYQFWIVHRWW